MLHSTVTLAIAGALTLIGQLFQVQRSPIVGGFQEVM